MRAYVIFEEDMTNPEAEGLQQYIQQAPSILKRYGGKLLTANGTIQTLEGDWHPRLLAMVEFESVEQARRWYSSDEYTTLIPLRRQGSNSQIILVEGTHDIEWPTT